MIGQAFRKVRIAQPDIRGLYYLVPNYISKLSLLFLSFWERFPSLTLVCVYCPVHLEFPASFCLFSILHSFRALLTR